MAKNLVQAAEDYVLSNVTPTQPATPTSGDPGLLGQIPGVCLNDAGEGGNAAGAVDLQTAGIFDLAVEAVDNVGNSAVASGDILYYDAAATIKINKDAVNGVRFGYALEVIAAGANDTIQVKVGY